MKFTFSASPNLRQQQSTKRIMLELTIGLLAIYAFSLIYYMQSYGSEYMLQAVLLMATSLIVAMVTETAWAWITKQDIKKFLGSSFGWVTAIILTLMCPISIKPFALGMATFFAILVGKLVFGGFGQNIFNPAAFGRAIIFVSFASATTDIVTSATPTTIMATNYNWLTVNSSMIDNLMREVGGLWTMFNGWYPGALGETSTLLILIIGVVLAIRKVIDWRVPVIYMGSIFVMTSALALFAGMDNWLWYPAFHLCTGGVAFGAVFMLTDPVTSPTSAQGRCIFALGAGIITVLIRVLANLPEGCLYSILLMNCLTPAIEQALTGKQLAMKKKAWIIFGVITVLGLGSIFLANQKIEPAEPKKVEVKPTVKLSMDDEYTNALGATLDGQVVNEDGSTTYTVTADGFASVEGLNMENYDHPTEPNVFEITIASDNKTIVSLKPTVIKDTEYIGDKIAKTSYLSQFEGKDISTLMEVEKNDAVSGATYSVKSSMRALLEVKKALGY